MWQYGIAVISMVAAWVWWKKTNKKENNIEKQNNTKTNGVKHQELHNKESFGEKDENKNCKTPGGGIPNLAFAKEEDVIKKQPKIVTSQPQTVTPQPQIVTIQHSTLAQPLTHNRNGSKGVFRDRQISDISAFFAVGEHEDPDLTDMVMDELNKSMPVLPTKDELVIVPIDTDAESDVFTPANDSDDSVKSELIEDSNERIRETFEFTEKKDKVKNIEVEDYIPPSEKEENVPPKIEEIPLPTQRSTEWRDKLIENLMNDDIEFELSDSESEVSSICASDTSEVTEDMPKPPQPMNDVMKGTTNTPKEISSDVTKSYKTPIVIDNGSYELKLGFAGELTPEHQVRSLVGKWRDEVSEAWKETYGEFLIGEDAINRHSALNIQTPHKDGVVQDWKLMGKLWEKSTSSLLEAEFKEHPLLVTEPTSSTKQQRERTLELAIEKLYCPLVHVKSQAALSAMSVGSDVVLVINSGYGCTEVVPVYCGHALTHAANMVPVGGAHITDYLARLIKKESGHNFSSFAEMEVLNKIKEGHAVMRDGNLPLVTDAKDKPIKHELPDGQVIELKNELTLCTEPLYRPDLIGLEAKQGLTYMIQDSINRLDSEIRQEMCDSLLLTGGTSRLSGFKGRINHEINEDSSYKYKTTLADVNSAWIGGSLFASEDNFNSNCISDDMYFEYGSSVVHRMCF